MQLSMFLNFWSFFTSQMLELQSCTITCTLYNADDQPRALHRKQSTNWATSQLLSIFCASLCTCLSCTNHTHNMTSIKIIHCTRIIFPQFMSIHYVPSNIRHHERQKRTLFIRAPWLRKVQKTGSAAILVREVNMDDCEKTWEKWRGNPTYQCKYFLVLVTLQRK